MFLNKIPASLHDQTLLRDTLTACACKVGRIAFMKGQNEVFLECVADDNQATVIPCVYDFPYTARLLQQLSGGRRLMLPNIQLMATTTTAGASKPGVDATEIGLGSVTYVGKMSWRVAMNGNDCILNWRMPCAVAAETRMNIAQHIAVASSLMGTESPKTVRAIGMTVLPHDSMFGALVLLTLTDSSQSVSLRTNASHSIAVAAKIGNSLISFAPHYLRICDLYSINMIRNVITSTLFDPFLPKSAATKSLQAFHDLLVDISVRDAAEIHDVKGWQWISLKQIIPEHSGDREHLLPPYRLVSSKDIHGDGDGESYDSDDNAGPADVPSARMYMLQSCVYICDADY